MDHKNLINGLVLISMLVIGLIIKNMDLVFSIILMAINIKEDGKLIKDMDKVLIGLLTLKINWEDSTLVIGNLIKNKEEVLCSINLVTDMMVCGWIIYLMVKEEWYLKMEMFIKVCGFKVKEVAMVF